MKILLDYCWYKISKFYQDWGEKDTHIGGSVVLFGCLGFNFLSILCAIFALLNIKFSNTLICVVLGSFIVLTFFYSSEKRYKALREKYKNEKHRKLKSWLVFLYFVFSIATYGILVNVLDV